MTDSTEPIRIDGRYLLEERLARGGSAEVWRARDEKLDRPVAVKLLHPHLLADESARLRLAEEARLVASLRHPRIVQTYDVVTDADTPALIMELIEGESLSTRLEREGALPPLIAASIGSDVADALAEAHRHGIIHRDVKPSNILIDEAGHANLADFGIAHSLESAAQRLTQTGTVVGTPAYISPEQLAGRDVGPRTDLFGLGAALFEMLIGRPPFEEVAPLLLAKAHAAGPPPMPDIDSTLADLTRACLSNDPAQRPSGAAMVASTLRAFHTTPSADRNAETRAIPVVAAPSPPTEEEHLVRQWRRGLPLALGATGLFVAILLVAALLGPGRPAAGEEVKGESSSPVPGWLVGLMADYADACGATLDPSEVDGLTQSDAEAQVAGLIDACASGRESAGGSGNGPGKGKGNGGKGRN
jgi:serine/threonine protein kinase